MMVNETAIRDGNNHFTKTCGKMYPENCSELQTVVNPHKFFLLICGTVVL